MKRTSLMVSVAVIALSASGVLANAISPNGNNAFVGQLNNSNLALLSQQGSNQGFIYQYGTGNVFLPWSPLHSSPPGSDAQEGNNSLGVEQLGKHNFIGGLFGQSGTNEAGLAQFGDGNVIDNFLQLGDNRAAIFQGGDQNLAQSDQSGTGNDAGIVQINPHDHTLGNLAFNSQLGEGGFDSGALTTNSFEAIGQLGRGPVRLEQFRPQPAGFEQ